MDDDRPQRWDRPLALVLLGLPALVILAATFVSSGATRIYTWPWAFYVQAALLAPWLWCAWNITRSRAGLREAWWIAAPLLSALTLSIATSAHWHDALEASLPLVTPLVLLPLLAQAWRDASAGHRLIAWRVAGAIFAALAAWSLVLWLPRAPESGAVRWFFAARNPHPLGHWNYTGGLALLGLPILVLLAWRERGGLRALWTLAAVAAGIQLLSAGSRGAALGLLAATVALAAFLIAQRRPSTRTLVLGAAALLALGAVTVATNPRLRAGLADPASVFTVGESEQQRLGFLLTGLAIAKAHPWTGIGPGTTPYHYPEHRVDLPGSLENSFQLHCGPLQWWVDTGVVGLAALIVAAGALKLRVWRMRRALGADAAASLVVLVGYGVMWLTDYQLDAPLFPIVLALAASVLVAETASAPGPASALSARLGTLLALPALACALLLTGSWQARAAFADAWSAKDAGDFNGFIKDLRRAASSTPWFPYHQNHLARALAGIAAHLPPETSQALRAEARVSWEHSLAVAPAQDHPWINLGWLALADDRTAEAADLFAKSATIQPRRSGLWFGTAIARLNLEQADAAAHALAREVRLDPRFVTSPLWNDSVFSSLRSAVLARLSEGWAASDGDRGAAAAPDIADFARWWWFGEVTTPETRSPLGPSWPLRPWLARIDDPNTVSDPAALPAAFCALREHWRTGASHAQSTLPPELISSWAGHVQTHPGSTFSDLLRTWPVSATRQVQRGADGILFRQTDGDPLSDLTALPDHPIASILAPILPKAAVGEFLDPAWTERIAGP